ncbi:MAG: hypothetical protein ABFD79_03945 [Phycisphaerales bacterium]
MKKLLFLMVALFFLPGCYSCQSWHHMWGKPREDYPAGKFMWDKNCKPLKQVAKEKPAPKQEPPKPQPAAAKSACGSASASGSYPCETCTLVKLEKNMPAEVEMNSEFSYTITVTNPTEIMLKDVVVTETTPENFKASGTNPKAQVDGRDLIFGLGVLEPGATKVITIAGMATTTNCLQSCANVSYVIPTCTNVNVVQPALKLVKTAPASALLCETIPVKFIVTNTGSGSAGNVKIEDALPAGLKTVDGKSSILFNAGTLAAGQSKEFNAVLKADKTGKYENKAVATSANGLKAEASTITEVQQPVLAVSKNGPDTLYIGRTATYEIKVVNKGNSPAANTIVTDTIPAGVTAIKASNGGTVSGSNVVWNIGSLPAGAAKTVQVSYTASTAGAISNTAKATASCAEPATASATTNVTGIAAVLLEVIDTEDPIEIGSNETYVITATNQGSMADTNIRIVCTLEDNEQYVSSSGATTASAVGQTVTFEPLPSLAPKTKATWRVVVKAVKPGDVRFTVTMTTDQLTRPVQETEATNLYQ